MNDITQPLTLAFGSHKAGSGFGCAMNVLSWENGDATITDYPDCTLDDLAALVQEFNDLVASVRTDVPNPDGVGHVHVIPAEVAVKVLDIAHRTVGSNDFDQETTDNAMAAFTASLRDARGDEFVNALDDVRYSAMPSYMLFGELVSEELSKSLGIERSQVIISADALDVDAVIERFTNALNAFWTAAAAQPTPVPETVTAAAVCKMQEVVA